MSKVFFWGKGFQVTQVQDGTTLFHHSAFLNTLREGRLELYLISDYAVDVKVESDTPVVFTERNKPTQDQFGTAFVFKPNGVGKLTLTIDGFECPPIRWSFTNKEKLVYDFDGEPLTLQRYKSGSVWMEPRTPAFYRKKAIAELFTQVRNASSEEVREELKHKLVELLKTSEDDDKSYYMTLIEMFSSAVDDDDTFETH